MKKIKTIATIVLTLLCLSCDEVVITPQESSEFTVKIMVNDQDGDPVGGLRISVWNHLSIAPYPQGRNGSRRLNSPLSTTSIGFSAPARSKVTLTVSDFNGLFVSTLVDSSVLDAGLYRADWSVDSPGPTRIYKYKLRALDAGNDTLMFQDSLWAVLWQPDADRSILGWTSPNGEFETADQLFFPGVLDLPRLIQTNEYSSDSIGSFTIRDTVSIVLTDTLTRAQLSFQRVIKRGKMNEIRLTWNPARAGRSLIKSPELGSGTIAIRRIMAAPFTWKLYQSYPNPFN